MALKTLMTTAAAAALVSTTALANSETLNRQNPQPADGAVQSGTEFDATQIETNKDLQNAETLDRQDPQSVDPVTLETAGVSDETVETFRAIEGSSGSVVKLEGDFTLGTLLEIGIDNAGKGEMIIDISENTKVKGDELSVTTGPENVTVKDGMIYIAATADEMAVLAGGDRGVDDGRQRVFLN